ncbi:LAME_0F09296g1_1 [Lachancea meyersii CBS 8951]|uniref:LAME_0F09296g1_1 n=1 Tax=Lachancea meyersii CBS 8951 TaxID=1266667 RepID=A0A1G4JUW6_9SACH|nr:LAME_0F09296g1_1 [Lachancea meyersii CBS 8951]
MDPLENAITGAVASSIADTVVYPLDIAKTFVQTQTKRDISANPVNRTKLKTRSDEEYYKSTYDALLKIYKAKGVRGLYQGLPASLLAGFLQSFSYFFWYSVVRKIFFRYKLLRGKIPKFSTPEELVLGILAAAVSQLFTNPIGVISKRQQTISKSERTGFEDIVKQIYDDENNYTGFWKGLKVSLILTVNPSITYASYERLKDLYITTATSIHQNELLDSSAQLTPRQNFILGVMSKMISTIVTQPLIISKAWLQRANSNFKSFQEVLIYLYQNEGVLSLWKGLAPQISKGVIVQGLMLMFKGELTKLMRRFFLYLRLLRSSNQQLKV